MKTLPRLLPILLGMAAPALADPLLFKDDFENGFSPEWIAVSPEVKIVSDPLAPENKVAALPPGTKAALHGPPVKEGDWKGALERNAAMDAWSDYELSFRFRLEKIENKPEAQGNSATLFRISSRIHPQEENPHEQRLFYMGLWRPKMTWRVNGPRIPWYGTHEAMENFHNIHSGEADTEWKEVRVVHVGDTTEIHFNGRLEYSGGDERAPKGGFSLSRTSDDRTEVGTIYLDDIRVRKADASQLQGKK